MELMWLYRAISDPGHMKMHQLFHIAKVPCGPRAAGKTYRRRSVSRCTLTLKDDQAAQHEFPGWCWDMRDKCSPWMLEIFMAEVVWRLENDIIALPVFSIVNGIYNRGACYHNGNGNPFKYKCCWSLASVCILTQSEMHWIPFLERIFMNFTPNLNAAAIPSIPKENISRDNPTSHPRLSVVSL